MKARNGAQPGNGVRGFSLVELMIVMLITMIMAAVGFIAIRPVIREQKVTNGYNTVLGALRQARDNAVAQRTSYSVTFDTSSVPHKVTIAPMFVGFSGVHPPVTYTIPNEVRFDNEPGIPNSAATTPDNFGNGGAAVDFGYTAQGGSTGDNVIYFCPDGSAQDELANNGLCQGHWSSGVLYIARPGDLMSSRAVTVWGATGRIRGWRLVNRPAGGIVWMRQ